MPLFIRYYLGPEPGEKAINDSEAAAIFARDRITTNRWTFNLGLRVDQQEHKNDTGEVTVDSTDISPRLAAVYDIRGDGQLLVSASAGRYLSHVPQQWSAYFNDTPTGIAAYDQYGWNPATQDYDRYQGRTEPSTVELTQVDPYDKIEYTLGLDWAFHPIWAFKTKLVYWEMEKIHQYYEQLDGSGGTVTVAENHPFAELSHTGIHFVLQRRFKNRWSLATSYSYAETTGNCGLHVVGHRCQDYPGELIDLVNPETGVPWTVENRDGELPTSRPLNLSLEWAFPVIKTLNGALALDITNATNEQVVIGTMGLRETGAPLAASLNYQRPRYYRLMAKIAF
jgi:outer membrane receptor protein involved in Fe transport